MELVKRGMGSWPYADEGGLIVAYIWLSNSPNFLRVCALHESKIKIHNYKKRYT